MIYTVYILLIVIHHHFHILAARDETRFDQLLALIFDPFRELNEGSHKVMVINFLEEEFSE